MALTLLVDLDDTLLGNGMEIFIPEYLDAFGSFFSEIIPPQRLVASMLDSTKQMLLNKNPTRTLKEVFDSHFFPSIGFSEVSLRKRIHDFYSSSFPSLQKFTRQRPAAKRFITSAINCGYFIGIATNPVFPKTAIIQRLKWAGFPEEEYKFSLIPSYETFHFAKPDPAYYAEFLTRLGWPQGPKLMVGNDPDHDIRGSHLLGIPSFWVNDKQEEYPSSFPTPDGIGEIDDILPWLGEQNLETLTPDINNPTALKAILRGVSAGLSIVFLDIDSKYWTRCPGEKSWSLTEILCHLRDVEYEVNLPRLKLMIQEKSPFIPAVDSDKWAQDRGYNNQNGLEALSSFQECRLETLDILNKMGETDWGKNIRHSIFGSSDINEIVYIMAQHDILHVRQIADIKDSFLTTE
jgi:FMN phosphatase YigB (HAD superfamily)